QGRVGELIVSSPYVTLGLWVNGRFAGDSADNNGALSPRLFRTGDLVRERPDGLLERIGRKDRQVKIRGSRVDLDGVEAALRRHPLVRDVGAVARTSSGDGHVTLVAYVSARDGADTGLLDDLKELMQSVPPPMRPGRLYLTQNIPRLPSSKLDVCALMAMDEVTVQNERDNDAGAGPVTGDHIEQVVAQVWQEVLRTPVRDPKDDFFAAGGDSLTAIT